MEDRAVVGGTAKGNAILQARARALISKILRQERRTRIEKVVLYCRLRIDLFIGKRIESSSPFLGLVQRSLQYYVRICSHVRARGCLR